MGRPARRARERSASRSLAATRMGDVALRRLALLALAVILVPALASRDPLRIEDVLARRLVPPFAHDAHGNFHLLGTDRFGRDLFVRMMLAGRLSLLVGVVGAGARGLLGTLLGALAGWRGGVLDRSLMALADLLLALPRLVLLLVGVALWSAGARDGARRAGRHRLDGHRAAGARRGDRGARAAIRRRRDGARAPSPAACCSGTCSRTPSGPHSSRRPSASGTRSCSRAGCRSSDSASSRRRRAGET